MIIKDKEDIPKKELIPKGAKALYTDSQLGYIGGCYVIYKLAQYKLPSIICPSSFDYDILTANSLRIEVKTSKLRKSKKEYNGKTNERYIWTFSNHNNKSRGAYYKNNRTYVMYMQTERDRDCDFFVFVCMDKIYKIIKTFVVPKEEIGKRMLITIPHSGEGRLNKYYDMWELIVGDLTDGI